MYLKSKKSQVLSLDFDGVKTRKKIFAIALIVIALALFTSTIVGAWQHTCDAVNGKHEKGEVYPCFDGWHIGQKVAYELKLISSDFRMSSGLINWLRVDFDQEPLKSLWGMVSAVYEGIIPIGYLLVILYCVIEIIDSATRETLNLEQFIKILIKVFIGVLLISNGLNILSKIAEFGTSLVDALDRITDPADSEAAKKMIYDSCVSLGWLESIFSVLVSFIPFILSILSAIVIMFTVYSRYIEICLRALFAPIGMANIYDGGFNSSGMKYLKKYAACLLQGAIMLGILLLGETLSNAVNGKLLGVSIQGLTFSSFISGGGTGTIGGLGGVFTVDLLIALIVAGMLVKAKNFANDLMGV